MQRSLIVPLVAFWVVGIALAAIAAVVVCSKYVAEPERQQKSQVNPARTPARSPSLAQSDV